MTVSIIVPAHNNARELRQCLGALVAQASAETEIIVVDDASQDDCAAVAGTFGARVFRLPAQRGPAAARNVGAREAQGEILLFVDADVVASPGAVARVRRAFEDRPDVSAVFGSYDDQPRAEGLVSQYRNLLHHFVHQNASTEASTFWAGCGAVRRTAFLEVGGFDETRFPRPSIEDIELGYRLRAAGHRILLDKSLLATHLKHWTLRNTVQTDIRCRAVPWSRLMLERRTIPNDLNLASRQRLSVALVGIATVGLLVALLRAEAFVVSAVALLGVGFLNRDFYAFLWRRRGWWFAVRCFPLHLLYFLYSGLTFLAVWMAFRLRHGRRTAPPPVWTKTRR
jgi:GT2 family glycosyltransferase